MGRTARISIAAVVVVLLTFAARAGARPAAEPGVGQTEVQRGAAGC